MAKIKWLLFVSVACLVHLSSAVGIRGWRAGEDESGRVQSNKLVRMSLIKAEKTPVEPVNYKDFVFYGEVTIGTPPQKFRVALESGFDMFWIASTKTNNEVYKVGHTLYNSSQSSTYQKDGQVWEIINRPINAPGSIHCESSIDTVGLGDISVRNQIFGELKDFSAEYMNYGNFDGILGLGFDKRVMSGHLTCPFQAMVEQKLVDQPVYSVYIEPNKKEKPDPSGGEIIFGGIDQQYYEGEITYVPVVNDEDYGWHFKIDSVSIGNQHFSCYGGCRGFVETGSRFIYGPHDDVHDLNARLGADFYMNNHLWRFAKCEYAENLPPITFKIGGRNFEVTSEQYVLRRLNSDNQTDYCYSGLSYSSDQHGLRSYWSFGSIFVAQHYTIFDLSQQRIGFTDTKIN